MRFTLFNRPMLWLAACLAPLAPLTALAQVPADPAPAKPPAWNVNQPPGTARTVTLDTRTGTRLQRAGVPANIGAHGQREGLGAHWEMWMFALGGMTPLEALRTATLNPARTFGLDADLGSLEVGKLADLVIIDGDVLADIRHSDRISQVMQNGRLFDAATLNEVVSRQRPRTSFYFEGPEGRSIHIDAHAFCAGHGDSLH